MFRSIRKFVASMSVLLVTLVLLPPVVADEARLDEISQEALLEKIKVGSPPLILDVRSPAEFSEGHVPGAINIPHVDIKQRLAEITDHRDRPIVVYCLKGVRAKIAAEALAANGFSDLHHLVGDMAAWEESGRPME